MNSEAYTHLACYSSNIAANTANAAITPVFDSILNIQNNAFMPTSNSDYLAAMLISDACPRGQIDTPEFRVVGIPSVTRQNTATSLATLQQMDVYTGNNLRLTTADQITGRASNTTGAAANATMGMWLRFGQKIIGANPVYRLRGTATVQNTPLQWGGGTIQLDQTLPSGRYQCVGLDVVKSGAQFARLVFPGSAIRPGVPVRSSASVVRPEFLDRGLLGVLAEFDSFALPNLEVFSITGVADAEVFLDLIRVGSI